MTGVVVLGSLNMDLVVRAPRFPRPGETLTGDGFATYPGGKGANQAVACARLGARTAMIGRVGQDGFGQRLRAGLEQAGVDTSEVRVDEDAPTGTALIVVESGGENAIVVVPGANGRVNVGDAARSAALLGAATCMVAQLEVPLAPVQQAAAMVRQGGGRVVLNAAPGRALPEDLLSQVDDLIVNETEAGILSGVDVGDVNSARQAAASLRALGPSCVIVTLGAQGALLIDDDGPWLCPTREVTVVDTTAAGDAFVGAWASAITRGDECRSALRYAVAAGTLATTVMGAQPSLRSHEQVMRFMEDDGV